MSDQSVLPQLADEQLWAIVYRPLTLPIDLPRSHALLLLMQRGWNVEVYL